MLGKIILYRKISYIRFSRFNAIEIDYQLKKSYNNNAKQKHKHITTSFIEQKRLLLRRENVKRTAGSVTDKKQNSTNEQNL